MLWKWNKCRKMRGGRKDNRERTRKHIWEIIDGNGVIISEQGAIKEATVHHFKYFYRAQDTMNSTEQIKIVGLYPRMVNDEESSILYKPVTLEELKQVLFNFKKDKSPGPDGWSTEFFTFFFDIVGEDLLEYGGRIEEAWLCCGKLKFDFSYFDPEG
jgi:hypothetical protein